MPTKQELLNAQLKLEEMFHERELFLRREMLIIFEREVGQSDIIKSFSIEDASSQFEDGRVAVSFEVESLYDVTVTEKSGDLLLSDVKIKK